MVERRRRRSNNSYRIWVAAGGLFALAALAYVVETSGAGSPSEVVASSEPADPEPPPTEPAEPTPEERAEAARIAAEEARRREPVTLDTAEHLPDFAESFEDPEPYQQLDFEYWLRVSDGKRMTRGKLEDLQQQWAEDLAQARARVADRNPDIAELLELDLAGRIERHFYLRDRIRAEEFAKFEFEPFVVYVQATDDYTEAQEVAHEYGPALQGLARDFRHEYVDWHGLELQEGFEEHALFVLTDEEQYRLYQESFHEDEKLAYARAHYDRRFRIGITYLSEDDDEENLHAALHEMTHSLEHAYFAYARTAAWIPAWLSEGLAEYLATRQKSVDVPAAPVDLLAQMIEHDEALGACVLPLADIAEFFGYGDAAEHLKERARANGFPRLSEAGAMQFLYRQSHLLMHYLHDGERGDNRDEIRNYVGLVLDGEHPRRAFASAFDDVDLDAIDEGFLVYLTEQGLDEELVQQVRASRRAE